MANVVPVQQTSTGADLTMAAATGGGDTITNAHGAILLVANAGSSIDVTFTGSRTCDQGGTHNVVVTVAGSKTRPIPVPTQAVNASTGNAAVGYSGVTSVTVAAYLPYYVPAS